LAKAFRGRIVAGASQRLLPFPDRRIVKSLCLVDIGQVLMRRGLRRIHQAGDLQRNDRLVEPASPVVHRPKAGLSADTLRIALDGLQQNGDCRIETTL
jgi:hypothetical protein